MTNAAGTERVDLASAAFAGRLASLLRERRRVEGVRLRAMARRSEGRYTTSDLRAVESGGIEVADAVELAALYGADLASILPARMTVEVDPEGRVTTAGVAEEFEPDDETALLTAYLRLIRKLRNDERSPVVALRHDDVEVLAAVLDEPGERIVDRLGELMDATRVQRRVMVGLFVSGAVVVGLAVTAVAATSGDAPESTPPVSTIADVALVVDDTDVPASGARESDSSEVLEGAPPEPAPADEPAADVVRVEPWSGPVAPSSELDVTPLAPETEPVPPAPAPTPTAPPATTQPDVAVAPPPVPVTTVPVVEPPAEPEPEPEVAVAPPPVPTTAAPLPDPVDDPVGP